MLLSRRRQQHRYWMTRGQFNCGRLSAIELNSVQPFGRLTVRWLSCGMSLLWKGTYPPSHSASAQATRPCARGKFSAGVEEAHSKYYHQPRTRRPEARQKGRLVIKKLTLWETVLSHHPCLPMSRRKSASKWSISLHLGVDGLPCGEWPKKLVQVLRLLIQVSGVMVHLPLPTLQRRLVLACHPVVRLEACVGPSSRGTPSAASSGAPPQRNLLSSNCVRWASQRVLADGQCSWQATWTRTRALPPRVNGCFST